MLVVPTTQTGGTALGASVQPRERAPRGKGMTGRAGRAGRTSSTSSVAPKGLSIKDIVEQLEKQVRVVQSFCHIARETVLF